MNGAGESDRSNNVSIPSLPDIGPVTASLTHQVWKHDGEIRVNVSFEVRYFYSHFSAHIVTLYPINIVSQILFRLSSIELPIFIETIMHQLHEDYQCYPGS